MAPFLYKPSLIDPGTFEPESHFYPRALNAQIHPLVRFFLSLGNGRIAERYCHLHPEAEPEAVRRILARKPSYFRWGGADLFHATTDRGVRRIVVIETNSCPSGQKSMPITQEAQEQRGYQVLLQQAFFPILRRRSLPKGGLAVLYDKNYMEASGYAAAIADLWEEPVHLVPFYDEDPARPARFTESGVLEVCTEGNMWHPIRAAFRYVTQRPWNRIPPLSRTAMFNPVICCLAGGRNKMLAAKAYDLFNAEMKPHGLAIRAPETIWNVAKDEIPLWVQRMGGIAVVKVPYSNAGQGVYTITHRKELDAFMAAEYPYDRFIVQALIGNSGWSSQGAAGRFYHVGTVPDRKEHIYVSDLRCMVGAGPEGFFPVAIYARRARKPLAARIDETTVSWDMLGTNLSIRRPDGGWNSDRSRLLLMDSLDFNRLGLGLDDLIEGYIQTVLAVSAIDRMATALVNQKGRFRKRLFRSLNPDPALMKELET
jgi:hypothetical protein